MTDGTGDPIRALLLECSDHRAVRRVFGAYADGDAADLVDYAEAMRATNGRLALVVSSDVADVYARWNAARGRYEYVTMWPPWSLGEYDSGGRAELVAHLEGEGEPRPILHEKTPFADERALASAAEESAEGPEESTEDDRERRGDSR